MAADGKVVIEIDGDDSKFKSKLSSLGGSALKGVTAAIGAVGAALGTAGAAAVRFGAEYETSLAKVGTIADTSVKSLDTLSSEIMALSNETGESAAGLNEALYSAISAGADTAHASELVGVAVKAARGGFTDTETAVDGLTSALNAYGMQTSEAEGLANQFLVTQNLGKTTFGELASSIGTVAPTAKAAGVPINELLSSVASLTANGIGTSEAMTGMKAALSNIIKPTSDAAKMAQQLGIDFSTSALKSKGWAGFLEEIKEKTGGNTDQMAALFGSVEALNTVLTLTSDQGMELMQKTMSEMETNTTALDDAYNTMSDTLQVTTQKIGTNLKNLGISLYQSVDTPINDIAESALDMVSQLQQAFSEGGLEGLVRAAGDIVAQLVTNLASAAPGMIDAAVSLIQAFLDGLQSNMPALADGAVGIVASLARGISAIAPQLAVVAVQLIAALAVGLAEHAGDLLSSALDMISALADGLRQAPLIDVVPDIISGLVVGFVQNLPKLVEVGVKLIGSLIVGLLQAIPKIIAIVPKIIMGIVGGFSGHDWAGTGRDAVETMARGVESGVPSAKSAGKSVLDATTSSLSSLPSMLQTTGRSSIEKLSGGIRENRQTARTAAKEVADQISGEINGLPSKATSIGKRISDGVAEGIRKGKSNAVNAIKNMAESVISKAKSALKINSPSRVMRDQVGRFIPLGVEEGISNELPRLERNVAAQMSGFTDKLQAAVQAETMLVSGRLSPPEESRSGQDSAPSNSFLINVYPSGAMNSEQARDAGREIGAETAREFRRRGLVSV